MVMRCNVDPLDADSHTATAEHWNLTKYACQTEQWIHRTQWKRTSPNNPSFSKWKQKSSENLNSYPISYCRNITIQTRKHPIISSPNYLEVGVQIANNKTISSDFAENRHIIKLIESETHFGNPQIF